MGREWGESGEGKCRGERVREAEAVARRVAAQRAGRGAIYSQLGLPLYRARHLFSRAL